MQKYAHILNGGSIAGLAMYALFLLSYYVLAYNPMGPVKWVGIWIPALLMYTSLKRYRETELEGFATFRQNFSAAIVFSFVFSSLSAMCIYLHAIAFDASYVQLMITEGLENSAKVKDMMIKLIGRDGYKEMITEYQNLTPAGVAWSDFTSKSFLCFVLAIVFSAVLRKEPPVFPTPHEHT